MRSGNGSVPMQLQRVGVVEQHALVPGDGQQRRPRAGGHRRDRVRPLGLRRASRRAASPGIGGGPSGLPIVTATGSMSTLRAAAFAAPTAVSGAPPSIHFLMTARSASGIFGPFGGMFGSAWCAVTLVEQALVRAAGLDRLAAGAAGHQRLVGGHVQVGRGLVRRCGSSGSACAGSAGRGPCT